MTEAAGGKALAPCDDPAALSALVLYLYTARTDEGIFSYARTTSSQAAAAVAAAGAAMSSPSSAPVPAASLLRSSLPLSLTTAANALLDCIDALLPGDHER